MRTCQTKIFSNTYLNLFLYQQHPTAKYILFQKTTFCILWIVKPDYFLEHVADASKHNVNNLSEYFLDYQTLFTKNNNIDLNNASFTLNNIKHIM